MIALNRSDQLKHCQCRRELRAMRSSLPHVPKLTVSRYPWRCTHQHVVLLAPSNYHKLGSSYAQIAGVSIQAFRLRPRDLSVSSTLTLMSVDQSQSAPLYVCQITKILHEMASTSPNGFDYRQLKRHLQKSNLTRAQQGSLL